MPINYRIEAIKELLNKDCVLERYYVLIPLKEKLVNFCLSKNCFTKEQCLRLFDAEVLQAGILGKAELNLFKRFLSMYDTKPSKLKELDSLLLSKEEYSSYKQLYLLPGVKSTRANLYYKSGIKSLSDLANLTYVDIIDRTTRAIEKYALSAKAPTPKEARTHIVVARAFSLYQVD